MDIETQPTLSCNISEDEETSTPALNPLQKHNVSAATLRARTTFPPQSPIMIQNQSTFMHEATIIPSFSLSALNQSLLSKTSAQETFDAADFECSLCFRLFYRPVSTQCGHTYCRKCLISALKYSLACPLCRTKLEDPTKQKYAVNIVLLNILEKHFKEDYLEREQEEQEEEEEEREALEKTAEGMNMNADLEATECLLASQLHQETERGKEQEGMELPIQSNIPQQTNGLENGTATKYCLIPIPNHTPEIPLRGSKVIIGRKTLSELSIKSDNNKKKLNVSRQQASISVFEKGIVLEVLGLNSMFVTRSTGKVFKIERSQKVLLNVGDLFTLCGNHFPFTLSHYKGEDKQNSAHNGTEIKEEKQFLTVVHELPTPEIHEAWIGKRAKVYWPSEESWYKGKIEDYSADSNKYKISYDDGDVTFEDGYDILILGDRNDERDKKRRRDHRDKRRRKKAKGDERKSVRMKKSVNYMEWISSSSDEGSWSSASSGDEDEEQDQFNRQMLKEAQFCKKKTTVLYSDICLKHFVPKWHLERPRRLEGIMNGLRPLQQQFPDNLQIVEDFEALQPSQLVIAHALEYIQRIQKAVPNTDRPEHVTQRTDMDDSPQDWDTFMSACSMDAALKACGAVCKAIDALEDPTVRNVFCAVRPPGHHCGRSGHTAAAATQGYCILNNVSVGAMYAQSKGYQRIAVVDFDVHHGNGTEEILGGKNGFLFASIHVGSIYPRTGQDGKLREKNVVNVSLPANSDSKTFQDAVDSKILPRLDQFQPDLLLLSAGFDAHRKDPTDDGMTLNEQDFFQITEKLKAIANKYCGGKIVSVLEGGYHIPSLRCSVRAHVISLMKE